MKTSKGIHFITVFFFTQTVYSFLIRKTKLDFILTGWKGGRMFDLIVWWKTITMQMEMSPFQSGLCVHYDKIYMKGIQVLES